MTFFVLADGALHLPQVAEARGGRTVVVTDAATSYAATLGHTLVHDEANRRVTVDVAGDDVRLPPGTLEAVVGYG